MKHYAPNHYLVDKDDLTILFHTYQTLECSTSG